MRDLSNGHDRNGTNSMGGFGSTNWDKVEIRK